jgi:hypothetical protein
MIKVWNVKINTMAGAGVYWLVKGFEVTRSERKRKAVAKSAWCNTGKFSEGLIKNGFGVESRIIHQFKDGFITVKRISEEVFYNFDPQPVDIIIKTKTMIFVDDP